jgi:formylglycine-generating enzyme required for sulfatase activity
MLMFARPFAFRGIALGLSVLLAHGLLAIDLTHSANCDAHEGSLPPGLQNNEPADGRSCPAGSLFMVPYTETMAGSKIRFEMTPIPAGTFLMGSPETQADHQDDEAPQVKVRVEPFWMGTCEVTWAEYKHFLALYDVLKAEPADKKATHKNADAGTFTVPTPLYDASFTYALGEEPTQPAVSMTQFAAKQYTKWLSAATGRFFRLPAEAEWEYACRAGTTTRFSFGEDDEQLADYAWYYENSDDTYHAVGSKQPNAWGLFDMHGNVGEMVLDQYRSDGYATLKDISGSYFRSAEKEVFQRVVRGGAWDQDPVDLRSAARDVTEDWRLEDPNFPKSPWWFTDEDSLCVGFRVIRPLAEPAWKDRARFYDADVDEIRMDVDNRLEEGRGVEGANDPRAR